MNEEPIDNYTAGKSLQALGLDGKQPIEWNIVSFKRNLDDYLKDFREINPTTSSVADIRKVVAELRKYATEGESVRKKVKAALDQKYQGMKLKYDPVFKTLNTEIKRFTDYLDEQENVRKDNKKTEIVTFFNANAGEFRSSVLLDRIFNKKWLNAGVKMSDIYDELFVIFAKMKEAIETIKAFNSPFQTELCAHYHSTSSLSSVLEKKQQLEDMATVEEDAENRTEEQAIKDSEQATKDAETIQKLDQAGEKAEELKGASVEKQKKPEDITLNQVAAPINSEVIASRPKEDDQAEPLGKWVTFQAFIVDNNQGVSIIQFCKSNGIKVRVP